MGEPWVWEAMGLGASTVMIRSKIRGQDTDAILQSLDFNVLCNCRQPIYSRLVSRADRSRQQIHVDSNFDRQMQYTTNLSSPHLL